MLDEALVGAPAAAEERLVRRAGRLLEHDGEAGARRLHHRGHRGVERVDVPRARRPVDLAEDAKPLEKGA